MSCPSTWVDWTALLAHWGFAGELDVSLGARQRYATDASVYEELPLGVVWPRSVADLQLLVRLASMTGVSLTARGAGTSLAGQAIGAGLVVDMTRHFTRVLALDVEARTVTVEPGVVLDQLNAQLRPHGLWLALDTSTANRCVIGGVVGNNSCGAYSVAYGTPRDQIVSAKVVLSDGELVTFADESATDYAARKQLPTVEGRLRVLLDELMCQREAILTAFPDETLVRRNTGYALDALAQQPRWSGGSAQAAESGQANLAPLLCGSEGTLGLVSEVTFLLQPLPGARALLVVHFDDLFAALDATQALLATGAVAVELIDAPTLDCTRGHAGFDRFRFWLQGAPAAVQVVEFFAVDDAELAQRLTQARALVQGWEAVSAAVVLQGADMAAVWEIRKGGLGLLMGKVTAKKAVAVIEDAAVPIRHLSAFMRDVRALMAELSVSCIYYGHASVGLIHLRPELDLTLAGDKARFVQLAQRVSELVKGYRGSLSGEHGDGRLRAPFVAQQLGQPVYGWLKRLKETMDPAGMFNPGKVIGEAPIDQSWRVPVTQVQVPTGFDWQAERGFAAAVEKCNGAGACRKSGGVMCPSFMATQDDAFSTRGRANLLRFALQQPDPVAAMSADALQDALALCLGCKGCKSECPASVDMARLKAETLYLTQGRWGGGVRRQLYRWYGRLLPWMNRARGLLGWLNEARAGLGLLGWDRRRQLPVASGEELRRWWQLVGMSQNPPKGRRVAVWLDVFSRYLEPETGRAVIEVLQRLGCVVVPVWLSDSPRLLISQGFLSQARAVLSQALADLAQAGDVWGLVGVEPAELLVLRDDALALLSGDEPAGAHLRRLQGRCWLFEEAMLALAAEAPELSWPALGQAVMVHVHCHQKSLAGVASSRQALALLGVQAQLVEAGCCGMSGSFGYEQPLVSFRIAELGLAPALRAKPAGTLMVACGSSCRTQSVDLGFERPWHMAQLFAQALEMKTGT